MSFVYDEESLTLRVSDKIVDIKTVLEYIQNKKIKNLYLFIFEEIILDTNLKLPSCNVVIIAPKWTVKKHITINLSGNPGKVHEFKQAKSGNQYKKNGEEGLPGLPGENSGHFYGIGTKFEKIEKIKFILKGGKGGKGQSGGNGFQGMEGKNIILDQVDLCQENKKIEDVKLGYTYYGIEGGKGGKGGASGKNGRGGYGGLQGTVQIFDTADINNPKETLIKKINQLSLQEGKIGQQGADAKPGITGNYGLSAIKICNTHIIKTNEDPFQPTMIQPKIIDQYQYRKHNNHRRGDLIIEQNTTDIKIPKKEILDIQFIKQAYYACIEQNKNYQSIW